MRGHAAKELDKICFPILQREEQTVIFTLVIETQSHLSYQVLFGTFINLYIYGYQGVFLYKIKLGGKFRC